MRTVLGGTQESLATSTSSASCSLACVLCKQDNTTYHLVREALQLERLPSMKTKKPFPPPRKLLYKPQVDHSSSCLNHIFHALSRPT